jgi:hypothetical protein
MPSSRLHNVPCLWLLLLRIEPCPFRSCSSNAHQGSCRFDLAIRTIVGGTGGDRGGMCGEMGFTKGDVGVLVPDRVTVLLQQRQ